MYICNAQFTSGAYNKPQGCPACELCSASHIGKDGSFISVSGTLGVYCMLGAEFLAAFLRLVQFEILMMSLADYFNFCGFLSASGVPCCSSFTSLFILQVKNLFKNRIVVQEAQKTVKPLCI